MLLICGFVSAVHVAADDDLPSIKLNRADCWCDENCLVFFPRLICSSMHRATSRRVFEMSLAKCGVFQDCCKTAPLGLMPLDAT